MLLLDTMNFLPCPTDLVDVVIDQALDSRQSPWLESVVLSKFTRAGRAIEIEDRFAIRTDCMNVNRAGGLRDKSRFGGALA